MSELQRLIALNQFAQAMRRMYGSGAKSLHGVAQGRMRKSRAALKGMAKMRKMTK